MNSTVSAVQDASQLTAAPEAAGEALSKEDVPEAESQAEAQPGDKAADGRYPERSPITGGWYGGEIGLQQFIEVPALVLSGANLFPNCGRPHS